MFFGVRPACFNSLFIGIGSAIRSTSDGLILCIKSFQFPFHRDRLCNRSRFLRRAPTAERFQFPFHRDRLCNNRIVCWWFLRSGSSFQFPFHRDRLCNSACYRVDHHPLVKFQFPFHRDRLCNARMDFAAFVRSKLCFNSLFIGIGSAIRLSGELVLVQAKKFQFPFHRDRLCNLSWGPLRKSHN